NIDRLVEQTTRVAAQVEYELPHSLFFEPFHRFTQLIVAGTLKTASETNVAGARTNHVRVANGWQRHRVANDREIQWRFRTRALHLKRHRSAERAAHILRDLFAGPTARVLAVDFENAIAILQTMLRSRRAFDG